MAEFSSAMVAMRRLIHLTPNFIHFGTESVPNAFDSSALRLARRHWAIWCFSARSVYLKRSRICDVYGSIWECPMLQYKAGYKFLAGGVHAQVVDFPVAITCAADLTKARRLLAAALLDVAETRLKSANHCRRRIQVRPIRRWISRNRSTCT